VINSIRAHRAEFGIGAPEGRRGVTELLHVVADPSDKTSALKLPVACLAALGHHQLPSLKKQIVGLIGLIMAWHRSNQTSKRHHYIPRGPGSDAGDRSRSRVLLTPGPSDHDRNFSAWIGLVPEAALEWGKDRLGSISKQGGRYPTQACSWPATLAYHTLRPRSTAPSIGPGSRRC